MTRTPSIPGIPGSGTNVRTVRIEDDPIHTICCVISAVLISVVGRDGERGRGVVGLVIEC